MHNFTNTAIIANSTYPDLKKFMANKELMHHLIDLTSFLGECTIVKQRLWHVVNQMMSPVYCKCGARVKWNAKNNTYRTFCSSACSQSTESVRQKTERTCMLKYGAKTNLVAAEYKSEYAKTMMMKFGVDNPFKSKDIQQGILDTIQRKYGVKSTLQLDWVQKKIQATNMERYGTSFASQKHLSIESVNLKNDREYLANLYNSGMSVMDIADQLNIGYSQLCVQFHKMEIPLRKSPGQFSLYTYITSLYNGDVIYGDRKTLSGKEIDILIPELGIGFEYDGLFWHSELSSGKKKYHVEKDAFAQDRGIKLYHITDFEWINKTEICKSRIASILNLNTRVFARKTTVVDLHSSMAADFLNRNHIQGPCSAALYSALIYNGDIVAVMSMGKSRYTKHQYELIRYASLNGVNVVGGASKLLAHMRKIIGNTEIVSYCDLRWGTGKLYENLGFTKCTDIVRPSYWYTKYHKTLEHRVKYQKKNLHKLLENFNSELSEWENMKNHGFDRYWNSGNVKYILSTTNSTVS